MWSSAFPPHQPPGSISKENLSPDVSKCFLTLCPETSAVQTVEKPIRKERALKVHAPSKAVNISPGTEQPHQMEGLHKYRKKIQFSNIHIYDFLTAEKVSLLGSIPFFHIESVFYCQDCFSITSDFHSMLWMESLFHSAKIPSTM